MFSVDNRHCATSGGNFTTLASVQCLKNVEVTLVIQNSIS